MDTTPNLFTAKEINPLNNIDDWEDDVLQRSELAILPIQKKQTNTATTRSPQKMPNQQTGTIRTFLKGLIPKYLFLSLRFKKLSLLIVT